MSAFDSGRTAPLQLHIRVNAIIFAFLDLCFKKLCASVKCFTLGRRQICEPLFRQAQRRQRGMHMRSTSIAIAIVVAIGLIWSVAAMSKLVPVDGSEMRSAAISAHPE
jgi:hypothetical protein